MKPLVIIDLVPFVSRKRRRITRNVARGASSPVGLHKWEIVASNVHDGSSNSQKFFFFRGFGAREKPPAAPTRRSPVPAEDGDWRIIRGDIASQRPLVSPGNPRGNCSCSHQTVNNKPTLRSTSRPHCENEAFTNDLTNQSPFTNELCCAVANHSPRNIVGVCCGPHAKASDLLAFETAVELAAREDEDGGQSVYPPFSEVRCCPAASGGHRALTFAGDRGNIVEMRAEFSGELEIHQDLGPHSSKKSTPWVIV